MDRWQQRRLPSTSLAADAAAVTVSCAIGCDWQELACIRCSLQTSPTQKTITLPSYRNGDFRTRQRTYLLTRNWHSGKWRAYYLMRHGLHTHTHTHTVGLWVSCWFLMERKHRLSIMEKWSSRKLLMEQQWWTKQRVLLFLVSLVSEDVTVNQFFDSVQSC